MRISRLYWPKTFEALLIRQPHENSGYLHALDPPQAHEEASNIWQLGSKIDNFTKTVYSVHTPLVFMIFVTN